MRRRCLICKKTDYPICKSCSANAFLVENCRRILASIGDLGTLKKTYSSDSSEIKNLNTSSFWDKNLSEATDLKHQDGMTQDRVGLAFRFLPKSARRVLDIGAGHGYVEELLSSNKNIEIFGNDISSVAVGNLKKKFEGYFSRESVYNMKYPRNSFDAIFALEVLEHIPPNKIFDVLKKIKNILRKNGSFIISIPANEGLERMKNNPSGHLRMYTENLIKSELEIAGYKVVKMKMLYAFKNLYLIKKVLAYFTKNRWKPNDIVILAKSKVFLTMIYLVCYHCFLLQK